MSHALKGHQVGVALTLEELDFGGLTQWKLSLQLPTSSMMLF